MNLFLNIMFSLKKKIYKKLTEFKEKHFHTVLILMIFSLISLFLESKENQNEKSYDNSNQNIKIQKNSESIDDILKQIDSARKKLKSQELRLQEIQKNILERKMNNAQ